MDINLNKNFLTSYKRLLESKLLKNGHTMSKLFEERKLSTQAIIKDMSPEHRKALTQAKTDEDRHKIYHAAAEELGGVWGEAPKPKLVKPTPENLGAISGVQFTKQDIAKFVGLAGMQHHHTATLVLGKAVARRNRQDQTPSTQVVVQGSQKIEKQINNENDVHIHTNAKGEDELFPEHDGKRLPFEIKTHLPEMPHQNHSGVAFDIKAFHSSANNSFEPGETEGTLLKNEDAVITTKIWHDNKWSSKRHNIEFGQGGRKDFLRVDQTMGTPKAQSKEKQEERKLKKKALDQIESSFTNSTKIMSSHTVHEIEGGTGKEWHVRNSKGETVSKWDSREKAENHKPIKVKMTWGEVKSVLGDQWKTIVGEHTHIVHHDGTSFRAIKFADLHDDTPLEFEKSWRPQRKTVEGATRSASLDTKLKFNLNPESHDFVFNHNNVQPRTADQLLEHFGKLHRQELDPLKEWVYNKLINRGIIFN